MKLFTELAKFTQFKNQLGVTKRFYSVLDGSGNSGSGKDNRPGSSNPKDVHRLSPLEPEVGEKTMRSWQIHSYGGPKELTLSTVARMPHLKAPDEVLVKVCAASVNPIDLEMTKGYGAETVNILRDLCPSATLSSALELPNKIKDYLMSPIAGKKAVIEFPLTLGRDFSGVVVQVGHGVTSDIRVGDEVFGVVGVQRQGSHAEYVVVSADTIRRKPKNIDFVAAASIPYVGLTTWSAIWVTGSYSTIKFKNFLVLGGSGGIGTFAIQYLRSQGAKVTTTCSGDALSLVSELGADSVIDYMEPNAMQRIQDLAPYDCILQLSGPTNAEKSMDLAKHLKPVSGQFITLSPPFLSNVDKYGLVGGTAKNMNDLIMSNLKSLTEGRAVTKWAFFIPYGDPLKTFADLIDEQKIKPVIHSVFKFDDLPNAYKKLEEGHLRGKVVVDMQ